MIFNETPLAGAYVIELERFEDERGFFARTFCAREFRQHDLNAEFVQCNVSHNGRKGTLRGMHYQIGPHSEVKLIRCTRGGIFDVIVDIRKDSESYGQWFGIELDADTRRLLYVPEGLAHGFITLVDDTEVFYQMGSYHEPEAARGFRWNDPQFKIQWPFPPAVISSRDETYADYCPESTAE